jgi:hypothetical protein
LKNVLYKNLIILFGIYLQNKLEHTIIIHMWTLIFSLRTPKGTRIIKVLKKESKRTKLDKKLTIFFEIELNFFLKKQKAIFFWKHASILRKITKIVLLPMRKINVFFMGTPITCYLQQRFEFQSHKLYIWCIDYVLPSSFESFINASSMHNSIIVLTKIILAL